MSEGVNSGVGFLFLLVDVMVQTSARGDTQRAVLRCVAVTQLKAAAGGCLTSFDGTAGIVLR